MCTHSQVKKYIKENYVYPPQGVNGAPYFPKSYASRGMDISKCIEAGSMKFTTLLVVDIIGVCAVTNAFPCNECNYIF